LGIKASGLTIISKIEPTNVLSLSYPDIVCTPEEAQFITGHKPEKFTENNRWHRKDYPLPETVDLFTKMGFSLKCVDIVASRGIEEIVDLNQPCDLGEYGLVLDCGTTEHCFNIGQALINAANAVKEGGYIFHTPPVSMMNHGFYNLNPTLFYDFYTQNGWEIQFISGEVNNKWFNIDAVGRARVQQEASLMVLAKRLNKQPLKYPIQSKYLNNPMLK